MSDSTAEPSQHFFESQRLRLCYWSWGDPANPPLVIVHGGRDHARSFDRVSRALCDAYHVVALDLRGHGDSDWAAGGYYGVPEQVIDLVTLIDLLGGRATVVAHSFGGRVALYAAGAFPERFDAIVSIEGAGSTTFLRYMPRALDTPESLRRWAHDAKRMEHQQPKVYATLEEARERMMEVDSHLDPEFALHLARYATREVEGGYIWKFDNWVRARTNYDLDPEAMPRFWADIECPVLHLMGADSRFAEGIHEREDLAAFRDAELVVVPNAGHWVHHDQLEIAVREIRSFLVPKAPGLGG